MIGSLKGSRTSPEKLKPKGQCKFGNGKTSYSGITEYSVHNVICSLQRFIKVLSEWHVKIFQLCSEPLVEVILALLGIEDGGLVSVVPEMASSDEPVTAWTVSVEARTPWQK